MKQFQPPHSLYSGHSLWAGTPSGGLCSPLPAAQTLGCSHPAPKPPPLGVPWRILPLSPSEAAALSPQPRELPLPQL